MCIGVGTQRSSDRALLTINTFYMSSMHPGAKTSALPENSTISVEAQATFRVAQVDDAARPEILKEMSLYRLRVYLMTTRAA